MPPLIALLFLLFQVISVDIDTDDDYRRLRDKYHILLMTSSEHIVQKRLDSSASDPEHRARTTQSKHDFFYSPENLMELNKDAFTASNNAGNLFKIIHETGSSFKMISSSCCPFSFFRVFFIALFVFLCSLDSPSLVLPVSSESIVFSLRRLHSYAKACLHPDPLKYT